MRTSTFVSVTIGTAVAGALGYAAYFDYKRRNDPSFRGKIRKDAKRSEHRSRRGREQMEREKERAEQLFIERNIAAFDISAMSGLSEEEKQTIFFKTIGLGEALLAQGSDHYLEAAAAFWHSTKVCPDLSHILLVFEQALPKAVLNLVSRFIIEDYKRNDLKIDDAIINDLVRRLGGQVPRGAAGGARLDEIDDADIQGDAGAATPPEGKDSASVSSQEWEKIAQHQPGEDLDVPAGSYAAAAATPVTMPHERDPSDPGNVGSSSGSGVTAVPGNAGGDAASSLPAGSYASAAAEPVTVPLGDGQASVPPPQPHSEQMNP